MEAAQVKGEADRDGSGERMGEAMDGGELVRRKVAASIWNGGGGGCDLEGTSADPTGVGGGGGGRGREGKGMGSRRPGLGERTEDGGGGGGWVVRDREIETGEEREGWGWRLWDERGRVDRGRGVDRGS